MARPEIRPFSDEFLAPAGELLAARQRTHRAVEPLLPAQYEEPAAAQAEVEALLALDGASGAIALRDGRVVGYLLGAPRPSPIWGTNVWIELAGHAVEEPEDLRDLHSGLARPEGAALLGWAATRPEVRGSGTGVAVTDWRVTNLLSSRFWPARGFRETFLRVYRHIP